MRSSNFTLIGGNQSVVDFVRARFDDVRAAVRSLRDDECIIVNARDVFTHDRARTYNVLRREEPDGNWDHLSRRAPSGAAILVILKEDEIGTALLRFGCRTAGSA